MTTVIRGSSMDCFSARNGPGPLFHKDTQGLRMHPRAPQQGTRAPVGRLQQVEKQIALRPAALENGALGTASAIGVDQSADNFQESGLVWLGGNVAAEYASCAGTIDLGGSEGAPGHAEHGQVRH